MATFPAELTAIKEKNLYRSLRRLDKAQGPRVFIEGQEFINFSSNDYLGFACHESIIRAATDAVRQWGTGSGASRLVSGSLGIHHELEERIAAFKREERALLFSSGFQANLGTLQALVGRGDTILLDRYCHASLVDGARLSGARLRIYPHLDLNRLGELLAKITEGRKLVVTDTYFSMDGDIAPLDDLVSLCRRHDAMLLVDDAHAVGVMGPTGRGLTEHFGVEGQIDAVMGTFSKALGSQGGFVAGSSTLTDYLINKARTLIYTTGPTPASSGASLQAIALIENDAGPRETLWSHVHFLREKFSALGFDVSKSQGPILPLMIGSTPGVLALSDKLRVAGILAPAIRPPTVPKGTDRIRFTVTAKHKREDLEHLVEILKTKA